MPVHLHVHIVYGSSVLEQPGRGIATETTWSTKPQLFMIWPFSEKKKLLISDVAEKRKRDKSFLIKMSTVSSSWLAQLELEHRTLDPGVVSLSFLDIEMT